MKKWSRDIKGQKRYLTRMKKTNLILSKHFIKKFFIFNCKMMLKGFSYGSKCEIKNYRKSFIKIPEL